MRGEFPVARPQGGQDYVVLVTCGPFPVLRPGQSLVLRAADGARPVIRLIDWQTDLPDALSVEMDVGSRFALDGILLARTRAERP